ncbi:CBS domain-containing protein CBSCBSPB3-like isoform X2 [Salvia miltiorrhiza]|uniref:CBS domain-containing protein CBSCBSPB3-like isoform X2 n=1 Tax=Salvia miltiorrhiza TaxID=226208 RepID=UPI0025AD530E|nr:CBS domain-containing protein CBSCBSPB3-like isoform X2 [Salvia miltiorrhiza]
MEKSSGSPAPLPRRNSMSMPPSQKRSAPPAMKRSSSGPPSESGSAAASSTNAKPSSPNSSIVWERTVKKLRLNKALTIPEATTVSEACRRMASRRVDAVLLTDSNVLLSGIVTDKDITTRVIAEDLKPENTIISKVMTRNPIFVNSDSLAIEALQKMVQGKFRHLPVVENGEVIALLDITKCLYDAISRMEKAAEQGSAIAAAVEGVERQFGSNLSASLTFIETLRERVFKPSLSTIISENSRVAIVAPSDPVQTAAKKMRELKVNSVLVMTGNSVQGILTSRDILFRVVAQNLSPDLTLMEKVMTPNPECATLETTILDALHIMHDRKFLHIPVLDKDGCVAACLDVLQISHAAISMVETSSGSVNDTANTVMQNFWDSALNMDHPDDYDTTSELSISQYVASEATEHQKPPYPSVGPGNSFCFKFMDLEGHVHRFNCGTEHLAELVSAVLQRAGASNHHTRPRILYEDDEGDKVLLTTDGDLANALTCARSAGLKVMRLHLDYGRERVETRKVSSESVSPVEGRWTPLHYGIIVALASIGVLVCLKRSRS